MSSDNPEPFTRWFGSPSPSRTQPSLRPFDLSSQTRDQEIPRYVQASPESTTSRQASPQSNEDMQFTNTFPLNNGPLAFRTGASSTTGQAAQGLFPTHPQSSGVIGITSQSSTPNRDIPRDTSQSPGRLAQARFEIPTPSNVLPSVENYTSISTDGSESAMPSRVSFIARSRSGTPIVSVTPPVNDSRPTPQSRPTTATGSFQLDGMREALVEAERLPVPRTTSLPPLSLSPSTQHQRRRSSSHVNVIPYLVEDEDPPEGQRFFHKSFQEGFGQAKQLMLDIRDVLRSSLLHEEPDSTIQGLHTKTSQLSNFRCLSTRTVGFVGDSGVGKSSLLNSLLDRPGIAKMGNNGAACTCAATEYHYHDRGDFRVEVVLLSQSEIDEQTFELLRAYRQYHLQFTSGGQSNGLEPDNVAVEPTAAINTFQAMFRGQLEDPSCLLRPNEGAVQTTLRQWAIQARPSHHEGVTTCETLQHCSQFLENLSSETVGSQDPAVWPYIKRIRVYLRAHILNRGLILVDLPGLRDINKARLRITQRYLVEQCDEILAVCHIGRATTDAGVVSIIDLARQAKLTNIGIVCTNTENIRAEETKRGRPDLADDIQQHVDNIVNLESKIDEANDSADECENIDDPSYSDIRRGRELRRKIQKLRNHKKSEELKLSTFLIESRNRQVIEQLRSQYSSSVPNGDLEVHCVSNTLYSDKRDKTRDEALPFINLSGIPALRRHCIGLVADAQSREVLNYIQKDIPALISELDIWVQNGAGTLDAERRRDIREVVNAVEHGIQSALNKNSSRIRTISSLANATFESKVYKDQHIERWVEGAVQASRVWHGWAPMTYKMFCGNFGYHSTPKQAVQSWNHQAMHAMTLDLSTRWRDFKFQLEGHHARVLDTVNSVQADAVQKIDDELSEFPAFISTVLGEVVSRRIQLLAEDIERHYTTLLEDLWILETNALTGICTSIFGKAMESSYDQANADSGSGSDQRRKAVIRETLSRDMLFKDHMTQFRQGFRKHTSKWRVSLADALDHRLSELSVTFDMIRKDHAAREGDQDPQFRNRLATELSNSKTEMRRINAMVGF